MRFNKKLSAKSVALIVCFTALYTVFGFLPISPIIGLPGKTITAAAIVAPVIGIILGPYIGMLSTILGGIIPFFAGAFSPPSLVSGVVTTFCSGILYLQKRSLCAFTYFSLLFLFGFYPFVGPFWLYPPLMWFQIIGFLLLISPLQSMAIKNLNSESVSKLFQAFFITFLTSTLAGQIAGSLVFEVLAWPIFMVDLNAWRVTWQFLTFIYPVERVLIALMGALIGATLQNSLKPVNLTSLVNPSVGQEKCS
ncbi:MAG: hypothetical protein QHH17_06930 [Candidatus Bathyarchaeota archaeon]|nr:hypothetical protein [Candidatus Bathyarchaeota archaeon]